MTLNDQNRIIDLWMQFLAGNETAFSELYCLFFDDLLTYGCRVGGDLEMVEDALQDIFLKLYQKKITLNDNTKLRPFLYRSLKNLIYSRLLRDAKVQPLPDHEPTFDLNYAVDDSQLHIDDYDFSDEVENIMRRLTGRQKEIIYLRFIHEMNFDEIAEIMEINIQSTRNLLARSMEKLRKEPRPYLLLILLYSAGTQL